MATDIVIKQEGLFKKSFKFSEIKSILSKGLGYGFFNESYVLEDLEDDHYEGYICVYDKKKIGRGFQLFVKDKEVFMTLPLPCTTQDTHIFYDSLARIMEAYKIKSFNHDDVVFSFKEIESVRLNQLSFLNDHVTYKVSEIGSGIGTHPAALYPITINYKELFDGVNEKDHVKLFDEYFEVRQAQDVFFPSQLLYKKQGSDTIFGIYALTEEVETILPKDPDTFLTLGRDEEEVVWMVALGRVIDDEYEMIGEVLYSVFKEVINFDSRELFFYNHIKHALKDEDIQRLKPHILTEKDKDKL